MFPQELLEVSAPLFEREVTDIASPSGDQGRDTAAAAAAAAAGRTLPQRDTSVKTIRQRMLQQQQEEVEELVVPLEQEGNRSASSSRSFELL